MRAIALPILGLLLILLGGCLPPTQSQLRMEMDLEEMKRRLAQVEQGSAEILRGGGPARQQLETLGRQLAEMQAGLDTLRVEFQSIHGRLDDLGQDNQQRSGEMALVRDDLGMQVSALGERLEQLEKRLKQRPQPAPVPQPQPTAAKESPEQLYQRALELIRKQQQFAEGRQLLEGFAKQYPEHDLRVNALYWVGEALYGEKNYEHAILQFQDVIQKYSDHPKAAAALLKQALAFKALGDNKNARTTLQKLIDSFPLAPETEKAKQLLKEL